MKSWSICFSFVLTIGLVVLDSPDRLSAADERPEVAAPSAERISQLIEQLGAVDYVTRERAQAELSSLGLEAFEALFAAQHHRDLEIATRCRYLIRGMNVRWFQESDPPEVKRLLKDYGDVSTEDRRNLLNKLITLPGPGIVPVVCRLVRYESDLVLSKYAAVKLIEQDLPATDEARQERADLLHTATKGGARDATAWLRTYAATLEDPLPTVPKWEQLISAELDTFERLPEQSSLAICRDLLRYQVSLLTRLQLTQEADAAIDKVIGLAGQSPAELKELTGWLVLREQWDKVVEVQKKNEATFNEVAELLYRFAQAQQNLKLTDAATATAQRALEIRPDDPDEHLATAEMLKDAGLFDWAQREYMLVIEHAQPGSLSDIRSRFLLSEMLHDQAQDLEAAKMLQAVVDVIEKDNQAADQARNMRGDVSTVYSRMHYFYSLDYAKQGDLKKQVEQLDKAIAREPTDADVLIALYRLPDAPPERKARTLELIKESADAFREEIQEYRTRYERAGSEQEAEIYGRVLSTSYNQFAWLIGNTTGDYQEALRYSQQSLELRPGEAGHLDTLARCYYSVGDLKNAISHQQQAVKIDAHSGQLRRQLEFFLQEQQKQQAAEKSAS